MLESASRSAMMYSLNRKIFVLFVCFRRLEMHESFRVFEANFCFKFVVLGRNCGRRSGHVAADSPCN